MPPYRMSWPVGRVVQLWRQCRRVPVTRLKRRTPAMHNAKHKCNDYGSVEQAHAAKRLRAVAVGVLFASSVQSRTISEH